MRICIILQVVVLAVVVVTSIQGHQDHHVLSREMGNSVQVSRNLRSQVFDLDVFEQQIADKEWEIDENAVVKKIKELEEEINKPAPNLTQELHGLAKEKEVTKERSNTQNDSRQVKRRETWRRIAKRQRDKRANIIADALTLTSAKEKAKKGEALTTAESNALVREQELTVEQVRAREQEWTKEEVRVVEKRKREAQRRRDKRAKAIADALTLESTKEKAKRGEELTTEESNALAKAEELTKEQVKRREQREREVQRKREIRAILATAKEKAKRGIMLTTEEFNALAKAQRKKVIAKVTR